MRRTTTQTMLAVVMTGVLTLAAGVALADKARARLSSFKSVPTLVADGQGKLKAKLSHGGRYIRFELEYKGISSRVLQAHLHLGNAWENGGIIVFLCTNIGNAPSADIPSCPEQGGVVRGTIKADDIIGPGGPRGIQPGDLDALFDAIEANAVYVNVHTEPFPTGQIRGQLSGH